MTTDLTDELNRSLKEGERLLWVSVVLQAIQDATDCVKGIEEGPSRNLFRSRARLWFRLSNPDFIEVCHLAHLDPQATHEKAMRAIARYDAIVATGETYKVERPKKPKPTPRPCERRQPIYTHDGKSLPLREWAVLIGVNEGTLISRLRNGHPFVNAIAPDFRTRYGRKPGNPLGRTAQRYTFDGATRTLTEWSAHLGVGVPILRKRLKAGLDASDVFAPAKQAQRPARLHTINGVSKTMTEWLAEAGICYVTMRDRMKSGMTLAEALAHPRRGKLGAADHDRGVPSDREGKLGTGAGSSLQERPNITFHAKEETA